jgi:hypothetical protein
LVIFWAKATIRDGDCCSGAVSDLATLTLGAGAGTPFVSTSFCRREDDRAEKDRRFCFLVSASAAALDEELEWKSELNLNLLILTVYRMAFLSMGK